MGNQPSFYEKVTWLAMHIIDNGFDLHHEYVVIHIILRQQPADHKLIRCKSGAFFRIHLLRSFLESILFLYIFVAVITKLLSVWKLKN